MKVLRLVERMTKGVTGLDDNSNREVKSLRVLEEREVKMMTLNEIYKTVELDGIPVTLLGIENLVATFQDIDGNEIEIDVDCETDAWKVLRHREKLDHLKYRVN